MITLPSGATVTLKDPALLRVKDRNKVIAAGDSIIGEVSKGIAFTEALLAAVIESWSFDFLPPSIKPESLGELTIADYDFLVEESSAITAVLFPALAKKEDGTTDPKVLTDNFKV